MRQQIPPASYGRGDTFDHPVWVGLLIGVLAGMILWAAIALIIWAAV